MGGGAPAAGSATTAPKPEEAEARKRRAEDAATARQQMVENERAALAEALSVLTPDQQAQAATLLRERAAKMGRARPPAAGPQGQQAPRQGHPRGGRGDGDGDGD